jgi:hypothetical protein
MDEEALSFLDRARGSPLGAAGAAIRSLIERATGEGGGRILRCAMCRHAITVRDARIEVDGGHEHVRRNPAGFVFRIGCFGDAPGCAGEGPTSEEWSWFPGYAWQMGTCKGCGGHLGWVFRLEGARFYGLILDRLVMEEEDGS